MRARWRSPASVVRRRWRRRLTIAVGPDDHRSPSAGHAATAGITDAPAESASPSRDHRIPAVDLQILFDSRSTRTALITTFSTVVANDARQ